LTLEDGLWADDAVSHTCNANRQRASLAVQATPGQATWAQSYGYDTARPTENLEPGL
jgi:hypothetical protein